MQMMEPTKARQNYGPTALADGLPVNMVQCRTIEWLSFFPYQQNTTEVWDPARNCLWVLLRTMDLYRCDFYRYTDVKRSMDEVEDIKMFPPGISAIVIAYIGDIDLGGSKVKVVNITSMAVDNSLTNWCSTTRETRTPTMVMYPVDNSIIIVDGGPNVLQYNPLDNTLRTLSPNAHGSTKRFYGISQYLWNDGCFLLEYWWAPGKRYIRWNVRDPAHGELSGPIIRPMAQDSSGILYVVQKPPHCNALISCSTSLSGYWKRLPTPHSMECASPIDKYPCIITSPSSHTAGYYVLSRFLVTPVVLVAAIWANEYQSYEWMKPDPVTSPVEAPASYVVISNGSKDALVFSDDRAGYYYLPLPSLDTIEHRLERVNVHT
jgi:hypothetical protein